VPNGILNSAPLFLPFGDKIEVAQFEGLNFLLTIRRGKLLTPRPTNETNAELLKNIKNIFGITDVTETLENPTFFTHYEEGNLVKPILDNVCASSLSV